LGVIRDPRFQAARLANIENVAARIEHAVHAWDRLEHFDRIADRCDPSFKIGPRACHCVRRALLIEAFGATRIRGCACWGSSHSDEIGGEETRLNLLLWQSKEFTTDGMTQEAIKPPRTVGPFGTALFQLNGMIGSGIFALPAVLVASVGSFAPVMIVFGGILILPLGLVFAWLATRFDGTGGPVLYGNQAFGTFAGFQAGWGRYASGMVALAANTHVMVSYFAALFPVLEGPIVAAATAFVAIVVMTLINILGMRSSVNALGGLTALKLTPLAVLVLAAVFGNYDSPAIVLPEFSQIETVVLLTFYAFIGFEGVTVPAGEMRNPKRDLPRVLISVLVGVTLIYVLVIWAYMSIATEPTGNPNALAGAAEIAFGQVGTVMIVLAAGFSIMANSFSGLVIIPRMAYGMAEQHMLPRWFMRLNSSYLTPANSIMFYGFAAAVLSLTGGFAALAAASTLTRLLTYVISAAALPVLEHREGAINPLHAGVALLAMVSSVWIASHANSQAWTTFGGLVLVGTLLYFLARRALASSKTAI